MLRKHPMVPCLLVWILAVSVSQGLLGAPYAVSVNVTAEKTALPGDFVTHVYTIGNIGTLDDDYQLEIATSPGWLTLGFPTLIHVSAGEAEKLFITLVVPRTAQAGTYEAVLSAISVGDVSARAEAAARVTVSPVSALAAAWLQEPLRASPGTEAQGTFTVSNTGNVADTYAIELSSSSNCDVALSKNRIFLFPGEKLDVALTVTASASLRPGSRYSFILELTSSEHPDVSTALLHSSRAAPPPPEEVGGSVFPLWPASVSFSFDESGLAEASFSGTGLLEGIGTLSATVSATPTGLALPTGSFSTDAWRISLDESGVSGGFGGISASGTGITFFGEVGSILSSEIVIAENVAGLSVSCRWTGGSLRLVGGSDATDSYTFGEVQFSQTTVDELFSVDGSVAETSNDTSSGSAFTISPEITVGNYQLGGSVLDLSDGFPNRNKEEAYSMTLAYSNRNSHSIGLGNWSLALYSSTIHTQTSGETALKGRTFLGMATIELPLDGSLRIEGKLESKVSDDEPPSTDQKALELDIRLSGPLSNGGEYSFSATLKEPIDRVAGTKYLSTQIDGSVGFGLASIAVASSLSVAHVVDLSTGLVEPGSDSSTFYASLSVPSIDSSPKLALSVGNGSTSLGIGLSWGGVSASASIPLSGSGSFSASVSAQFSFPLPFFGPSYARVVGRAFVDANGNEVFDLGDEPIAGLLLSFAGQEAVTGDDGRFAFWPVRPGNYVLSLQELPFGLVPLLRFPIRLEVGLGDRLVSLPFASHSRIAGTVYNDVNRNGRRDSGEMGVPSAVVLVTDALGRTHATTDSAGRFNATVEPGAVDAVLQVDSLPSRFVPTTSSTLRLHVGKRESAVAEFGTYEKPREIVFTYGPPTARFATAPGRAVVGAEVTFDGSESEAVGVGIVSYDWTFEHASLSFAASGPQVTSIFTEAGQWRVTLRVTDANGLQDTSQLELDVYPAD